MKIIKNPKTLALKDLLEVKGGDTIQYCRCDGYFNIASPTAVGGVRG
jgi:hypothetical protein